ncbi:molybdopterin molybdotransferase MoeA [Undibacterium flavidum]|uniref:Molybdopterin molybdenumtransferase n=1 Tax=Undibacterium flavidum TaxID=2762297 RepID=A0ABR6YD65_9BURK|nr:gephyrin-like molybdotransferase Glp [Undibacterium flavidum]MBC3874490.1 molybdopterin molybdenumtransferase MoeA [Undibacterium flavidum]
MSTSSTPINIVTSDNQFLSVAQAQQFIQEKLTEISDVEIVSLRSALGRVLAEDILSPINVPAHDNSAMDGFAFDSTQLTQGQALNLTIIGEALAGHPYTSIVPAGACVRIMTGAVMPVSCNTVIPQELIKQTEENSIAIPANSVRTGDNRRLCGEDLQYGKVALPKGKRIQPAELGLIASLGIEFVTVKRRLKIAYFSTGDEVRSLGEKLDEGCIYDSNRYTVYGMLTRLDCEIIDLGVIADHPEALEIALCEACARADAIITSGGVSVGAADYTKQVMAKLGQVSFWTIGMRPGRPMAFGQIQSQNKSAYLFGLPGNPVAVMVTFYFFVKQALQQLVGEKGEQGLLIPANSRHAIRKRRGRTEYQRGIASRNAQGLLEVQVTGSQGSGVLRSMSEANCMIVLNDEQGDISAGQIVDILLFDGLV